MTNIKTNEVEELIHIESMKCATKEEKLIAVIFINYYDLCIEQLVEYLPDVERFKQNGSISEKNIRDCLYLISNDEEYLYDIEKSDYFIKESNGYVLNTEKFEKENNILKEIFIFNGYLEGVSLSTILKQLKLLFKLNFDEYLICAYIIQFGNLLKKKENKYFIDLSILSKEELNIMNEIYNKRNRNKLLSILYSLKDKLNTEKKVNVKKLN